ncbi:MAG: uroporphyrinogen-III synthase [Caldilineaceae bacterium]|nr:uroporphyrinogen-III synthase [Caldilineaceae bacterium]
MAERPLQGVRIVNTRALHQAQELTDLLEGQGAEVLSYPAISIEPLRDNSALDETIRAAVDGAYDWLVLTSSNTVHALVDRLGALGFEPKALGEIKVAAVGSATAEAIDHELGLKVNAIPEEFVAEALADAIPVKKGEQILLPQSVLARPVLAEMLRQAGAEVTAVDAYGTGIGRGGVPLGEYFWRGDVDAVTFTSASTVHNFMRRLKRENGSAGMLIDVVVACIGPVTAEAARAHDLPVRIVPAEHTLEGLVAGLVEHFQKRAR